MYEASQGGPESLTQNLVPLIPVTRGLKGEGDILLVYRVTRKRVFSYRSKTRFVLLRSSLDYTGEWRLWGRDCEEITTVLLEVGDVDSYPLSDGLFR